MNVLSASIRATASLPAMLDSYGHVGNMAPPFGALRFAPTENEARVTPPAAEESP